MFNFQPLVFTIRVNPSIISPTYPGMSIPVNAGSFTVYHPYTAFGASYFGTTYIRMTITTTSISWYTPYSSSSNVYAEEYGTGNFNWTDTTINQQMAQYNASKYTYYYSVIG